jgi:hypothetical protein
VKKNNHGAAFKRKVAFGAIREHKTTSEIAVSYEVHPIQVGKRKKQLLDGIDGIFESPITKIEGFNYEIFPSQSIKSVKLLLT